MAKQELIMCTKLWLQHFVAGKNFSFNQFHKERVLLNFSQGGYFIKAIENFFSVFAKPDINTQGVGRIRDSYANSPTSSRVA